MDYTGHDNYIRRLQDRIHTAYRQIAHSSQWVKLTELRPYIGGHRELVDEALRRLGGAQEIDLVPEADQKTLTEADREAALWMGNQWKHLVAIDYYQR